MACIIFSSTQFDMLELDRLEKALLPCPLLLNPDTYLPDTVDLTQDPDAQEYWLQCFIDSADKVCMIEQNVQRNRCKSVTSAIE